jgi:hypothetical protein
MTLKYGHVGVNDMLHLAISATSSGDEDNYLKSAIQGILGVAGLMLAFNLCDSAYRFYETIANRGPFGPGPGFSPGVIRFVGAVLGIVMIALSIAGIS